jgi:hypothetical protein
MKFKYTAFSGYLSCLAMLGMFCTSLSALADTEETTKITTFDGVELTAVWTFPASTPKGVAVILQGSGAKVGVEGDVSGPFLGGSYRGGSTKLSEQFAATLARVGVASLRYAKRGVEDDQQLPNQTMPNLVKDAQAAMRLAQTRFANTKSFYIGFSEGALVGLGAAVDPAAAAVDGLFLFAPPTRSIDDVIAYQFIEWPLELLRTQVDVNRDGKLDGLELELLAGLPIYSVLGVDWKKLDSNSNGIFEVETEVVPAYLGLYQNVLGMLKSPEYAAWFHSLQEFPSFQSLGVQAKMPVYVYQALGDSQVDAAWTLADVRAFKNLGGLRTFYGLGHCFSPFEGKAGEIKTSGPIQPQVLDALLGDLSAFL